MNLRWLWFDYADPDLPLTLRQRLWAAFRPVPIWKVPGSMIRGRIICALGVPLPFIAVPFLLRVAPPAALPSILWFFPLLPFIAWIWGAYLYGWFCRPEHFLRLRMSGFNVCLTCGYWLRGLGDSLVKCPECGSPQTDLPDAKSDSRNAETPKADPRCRKR